MPTSLPKTELSQKIDEFLDYLSVERGSSPLTIRNYRHYLERFLYWTDESGNSPRVSAINQEMVRKYRLYLSKFPTGKGSTLSRKTQGYHAIALRSFLKYLVRNDMNVMAPDKIDLPKVTERQVKFLSGEHMEKLLNAPSLSDIRGKRDKAILETFFSTGLRVSELVSLNRDSVDLNTREFGVVGKGGKGRVVFLSKRACDWIDNYVKVRRDDFKPLFIHHKGKEVDGELKERKMNVDETDESSRLTPRSVQRMIKKYVKKVKLPVDATPHVLRHSFATDLLMAGADLRSVQEMLGHKNVQTTQIYTHVTHKHLKDIHESFHGRGN